MPGWNTGELGMQAASGAIGTALGLATAKWNDRRQLEQQKKLQELQMQGSKEMAQYNQGLALDMWEKTNYQAQREQLEKAGLNVGLMYKSAGEGGRLQQAGGSVTGGTAPSGGGELGMGMQLGLQNLLLKSQIANIEADTKKKNVEANKTAGADTDLVNTTIANIAAETENKRVQNSIMKLDQQMKDLELNIANNTAEQLIQKAFFENDKLIQDIRSAKNANEITEETMQSLIKQVNTAVEEQALRISAQKLGLVKMNADIKKVNAEIHKVFNDIFVDLEKNQQNWDQLSINEKQLKVNQAYQENRDTMTEFNTSTPAKLKQWVDVIEPFMSNRTARSGQLVGAATRVLTAK